MNIKLVKTKPYRFKYEDKFYSLKDIAYKTGIHKDALAYRLRRCIAKNLPISRAFDNAYWQRGKPVLIECPMSGMANMHEIARYMDVSYNTVKARINNLQKRGEPVWLLWDDTRWRGKYDPNKAIDNMPRPVQYVTPYEREVLNRIPEPSPLERRIFG